MVLNLKKASFNTLLFLSFLPFVGFSGFGIDTQPFAHIFIMTALFSFFWIGSISCLKINYQAIWLFISFCIALLYFSLEFLSSNGANIFGGFRSLLNFSTFLMMLVFFFCFYEKTNTSKTFIFIYSVWFVVGLIQALIYPEFAHNFLARESEMTGGRGVQSLASEPVEYARVQILFMLYACILFHFRKISFNLFLFIQLCSIVQISLFGLSGLGFVFLTFYLGSYFFILYDSPNKLIIFLIGCLLFVALVYLGVEYLGTRRVFSLINLALNNPEELLQYGGFSLRFFNLPTSIYVGLYESALLGNGVGTMASEKIFTYNFLGLEHSNMLHARAHGGMVGLVYELGIFGIIYILTFFSIFLSFNTSNTKKLNIFCLLIFTMVLLFDGSMANPLPFFCLVSFYFLKREMYLLN